MRNGGSRGKSEFLEPLIKCEGWGWKRGGGGRGGSRCFTITCEKEKEGFLGKMSGEATETQNYSL